MPKLIEYITMIFLKKGIITDDTAPWFRYGVEKRLTTLILTIPSFIIGTIFSNFWTAASFFISFYILRSRLNGYHAKKYGWCIAYSLLLEIFFFGAIYPVLNAFIITLIMVIGSVVVFGLAPYNHPNMHLTEEEVKACRISSRVRSLCMLTISQLCCVFSFVEFAKGIALGMAMAIFLLCLAYLLNGGSKNEKSKRSTEGYVE